jgi:methionine synthase I (cobalamin-dependent)
VSFHQGLDLPAFATFDLTMSHAELDEAEELDIGDPDDLGARYAALRVRLPALNVLGGCCGTDHRHVTAICDAWLAVH